MIITASSGSARLRPHSRGEFVRGARQRLEALVGHPMQNMYTPRMASCVRACEGDGASRWGRRRDVCSTVFQEHIIRDMWGTEHKAARLGLHIKPPITLLG